MGTYVTRSFLPPWEDYQAILKRVWESGVVTNQGECVKQLEAALREFLGVAHFHYVTNGTIALQLSLSALGIQSGEVITTPFSYVATAASILWERCKPVFVDIDPADWNLDASKIAAAVTEKTRAILAVHVFGNPCDVEKIQAIADEYRLKVIYDGAHAFGARYQGKSLLARGDISTCSFHATKLFHTVEGGAVIARDAAVSRRLDLAMRFGHEGDTHYQLGINAKQSEFHAAMGLANFPYVPAIIADRKRVSEIYDRTLSGVFALPRRKPGAEPNYAYYPVLFRNEAELLLCFDALSKEAIYPRRYFYPSLNRLPYLKRRQTCPVSEDVASRVACLPLYVGLEEETVERICAVLRKAVRR